jgi:isopentenyldiphosphate isomerase
MPAMAERFETFDDLGNPTGLVERDVVHATGLWHKSAHVFLFNGSDELYVQRRAAHKDLYPGLWDFSVGEHLKPGETFLAGALRGLQEELGVSGVALTPIRGVRRAAYRVAELGVLDRELQQAFRGRHDGPVAPDPAEVAAVEAVALDELAGWIRRAPGDFTPWFLSDLQSLELLPIG